MSDGAWYYLLDGKRFGPHTDDELVEIFHKPGGPGPETLVRNEEINNQWIPASKIEGLAPGPKNLFKLKSQPDWEEPEPPPPPPDTQNMIPCPRCKEPHPPQALICYRCRKNLSQKVNVPWDVIGLNVTRVLAALFLIWLILHWFEIDLFGSKPQPKPTAAPSPSEPGSKPAPGEPGNGLSKPSQSIGIDI